MTKNPFDMNQNPLNTVQIEVINEFLKFINKIQEENKNQINLEKQKKEKISGNYSLFSNHKKPHEENTKLDETHKIKMK